MICRGESIFQLVSRISCIRTVFVKRWGVFWSWARRLRLKMDTPGMIRQTANPIKRPKIYRKPQNQSNKTPARPLGAGSLQRPKVTPPVEQPKKGVCSMVVHSTISFTQLQPTSPSEDNVGENEAFLYRTHPCQILIVSRNEGVYKMKYVFFGTNIQVFWRDSFKGSKLVKNPVEVQRNFDLVSKDQTLKAKNCDISYLQ